MRSPRFGNAGVVNALWLISLILVDCCADLILVLPSGNANEIVRLCELWWTQERENRNQVLVNTLMFLMMSSSDPAAKKTRESSSLSCGAAWSLLTVMSAWSTAVLTRLYKMREGLALLDLDNARFVSSLLAMWSS